VPIEMKPNILSTSLVVLMLSVYSIGNATEPDNARPPEGYVPNSEVAIRIALAVWEPIYGHEQIASESPYIAKLKYGIWHVSGSLPEGWVGGVAEIEIDKETGKIIRVSHGE